jgi:histidine triad (HIT) family protein
MRTSGPPGGGLHPVVAQPRAAVVDGTNCSHTGASSFTHPFLLHTVGMPDCVFCAIVAGDSAADAESAVVWRTDDVVAFLDRSPVFKGHVLVVPTAHVETLATLPFDSVGPFFLAVQRVASVMPGALDAHGTFVAMNNVVSQSVPHLHAHVVPRRRKDGLRGFFWPRVKYTDALDVEWFASRLRDALRDR